MFLRFLLFFDHSSCVKANSIFSLNCKCSYEKVWSQWCAGRIRLVILLLWFLCNKHENRYSFARTYGWEFIVNTPKKQHSKEAFVLLYWRKTRFPIYIRKSIHLAVGVLLLFHNIVVIRYSLAGLFLLLRNHVNNAIGVLYAIISLYAVCHS